MIGPYEALIAGTEPITEAVLGRSENLRLIARVGIGLDSSWNRRHIYTFGALPCRC